MTKINTIKSTPFTLAGIGAQERQKGIMPLIIQLHPDFKVHRQLYQSETYCKYLFICLPLHEYDKDPQCHN